MGRFIHIFILILILNLDAAIGADKKCPSDNPIANLWAAVQATVAPKIVSPNTYQWLPKAVSQKLAQKHLAWLAAKKKNFSKEEAVPHAVALLGKGAEAMVYLVQTVPGKFEVLKQFHASVSADRVKRNMGDLIELRRAGVDTPQVLNVDLKKKSARLEFIEGFTVAELHTTYKSLGLSKNELELIETKFDEFVLTSYQVSRASDYESYNVVLDFKTGHFVVIDAN